MKRTVKARQAAICTKNTPEHLQSKAVSEPPAFVASVAWREDACQSGVCACVCACVMGSLRAAVGRLSIRITLCRSDSGDQGRAPLISAVYHKNHNSPEFLSQGADLAN